MMNDDNPMADGAGEGVSRRSFLKTTGIAAGAGLFGATADTAVAASGDLDPAFFNWRAREASHVWDRGYRGRPDRTVALHPCEIQTHDRSVRTHPVTTVSSTMTPHHQTTECFVRPVSTTQAVSRGERR